MRDRAAENLARMAADHDHDWPTRLAARINVAPLVDEEWLSRMGDHNLTTTATSTVTAAEQRVVQAASYGLTNEMIADLLCISPFTVKQHLKAARFKLRAKNTTHACATALRQGLIR
jgi:DNA-binding CsgD family transcriptional regulator